MASRAFSIGSKRTVLVTAGSSLRAFQSLFIEPGRLITGRSLKSSIPNAAGEACGAHVFQANRGHWSLGYGGLQTLRLLQDHPHFDVSFLGGERSAGKRWSELTPFLPLGEDLVVQSPDPDAIAAAADAAVLSLPNGLASQLAPELLQRGVRVVDLSADYRFPSLSQWSATYRQEAAAQQRQDDALCKQAVYGLVVWAGDALAEAKLVGARLFPTASLLALMPLLQQGLIEGEGIVIDAKTGTQVVAGRPKSTCCLRKPLNRSAPTALPAIATPRRSNCSQAEPPASDPVAIHAPPDADGRGLLATVYGGCVTPVSPRKISPPSIRSPTAITLR